MAASLNKFRLALVQMAVGANKTENLQKATLKINEAAKNGAQVVSIPECFNSPYGTKYFGEYSEPIPDGPSCQVLQKAARENKIYLIGGSIPEKADGKLYNTSTVWCPEGNLLAVHRKIHLFDIDVPGKITFKESETLSPGNSFTSFDTPWCKVGLGICYDIRFAELGMIYRDMGCKLLVYPGAFNMITGPAHIDTLVKSRALDNQVYVAFASPARDESAEYVAYANSAVASPWGEIVTQADEKESIIYTDVDLDYSNTIRSQIPISFQKRKDMYSVHNNLDSPPETRDTISTDYLNLATLTILNSIAFDRHNQHYKLDSKKVAETFNVDDLGKKTVFCRCWESKKFPLCDGAHGKHNQRCGDNLGPLIITKSE